MQNNIQKICKKYEQHAKNMQNIQKYANICKKYMQKYAKNIWKKYMQKYAKKYEHVQYAKKYAKYAEKNQNMQLM